MSALTAPTLPVFPAQSALHGATLPRYPPSLLQVGPDPEPSWKTEGGGGSARSKFSSQPRLGLETTTPL